MRNTLFCALVATHTYYILYLCRRCNGTAYAKEQFGIKDSLAEVMKCKMKITIRSLSVPVMLLEFVGASLLGYVLFPSSFCKDFP